MPKKLTLTLEPEQRRALMEVRATHEKPYLRERAAALLKIASGQDYKEVAATGLLSPYCRQSVATWIKRYQRDGLAGLFVQKGRGRKPVFFPGTTPLGGGAGRVTTSRHAYAGKLPASRESLVAQENSASLPLAQRARR